MMQAHAHAPRRRRALGRSSLGLGAGLALAVAALCGAPAALMPGALAQVPPPPGSNSDGRMQAAYAGGRFTLIDSILHRPIFQTSLSSPHYLDRLVIGQQCTPRIQMVAKPGGADLVFTYTNNTDRPLRLGDFADLRPVTMTLPL